MRTQARLFFILVFIGLFFIPSVNAVITYTEIDPETITRTGWHAGWNLDEDVASAPAGCVADLFAWSYDNNDPAEAGVRSTSSSLNRYYLLGEAEDGGYTASRFLVQVDGSGNADFYDNRIYRLVGYWEGVNFTEQWESLQVSISDDDKWAAVNVGLNLQDTRTHLITITNDDTGKDQLGGVRNTTSSIDRYFDIMEAEGGGEQGVSMFVQTDGSDTIEVYSEQYNDITFYNQGYFDDTISFTEGWWQLYDSPTGWREIDLSGLVDEVPRVVDIVFGNVNEGSEITSGVRTAGSIFERSFNLREAEGGGISAAGMTSMTNDTGGIEIDMSIAPGANNEYYFTGYFVFEISDDHNRTFTQAIGSTWNFNEYSTMIESFTQAVGSSWDFNAVLVIISTFTQAIGSTWDFNIYSAMIETFTQAVGSSWAFTPLGTFYETFTQVISTTWDFIPVFEILATFTQALGLTWTWDPRVILYGSFAQALGLVFVVDAYTGTVGVVEPSIFFGLVLLVFGLLFGIGYKRDY